MCGIAGVFRFDGGDADLDHLKLMTDELRHRGPDGAGYHVQGGFGLSMTRLAIIDVAGGQQPIFNEDSSAAIVCNGEIYNYPELRKQLEQRGHTFRTHSDVEVILHLYEDHGEHCFKYLNGMFGAAIADFRRQKLVLARDQFGQKPLYLWQKPGSLAFASELKALTRLPGFSRKISDDALTGFLAFRYVPAPLSIFEETQKLPPGSYLTVDAKGAIEIRRYWQIDLEKREGESQGTQMREQLTASVERHLMSERPLGVFLSGGVDSSAIVACMHMAGHRDIHTYTVGFQGFEENEFEEARRVSNTFHTAHQEVTLTAEDFWESLEAAVYSADEPMADLTAIPLFHLSKHASRDVVVVLSGEGSDELMAGYQGLETYRRDFDRLEHLRPLRPAARQLHKLGLPGTLGRRVQSMSGSAAEYLARNPFNITNVFDTDYRTQHGLNGVKGNALASLSEYYSNRPSWHGVDLYLGALIEWWLPDDLLHKADRMTMAHSIELRCPFLDAEFALYCAALPMDEKVRPSPGEASRKVALKREFASVLPKGLVYNTKKGFTIPVYLWLKTLFAKQAQTELKREDSLSASLFTRASRSALLSSAMAGDKTSQYRVWTLIILNKWADRWL